MYYTACSCPKGHRSYPESTPECCALSTAAAGLGGHFQPARDPGAFYQRKPASGFGIEASNIGPVITRREMRGRPQQVRPVWTNNPEIRGNAINGFGDDVVSTRVARPSMETAMLPAMAPVEDPLAQRPILLTTTNTDPLPSPPFVGPGPEASPPPVLPGFHWQITFTNWQLAGLAALVLAGGLGIYFVVRK